jgi:hypothetical protein
VRRQRGEEILAGHVVAQRRAQRGGGLVREIFENTVLGSCSALQGLRCGLQLRGPPRSPQGSTAV